MVTPKGSQGIERFGARKMLPLSLLRTAVNHPILVELKNGETYNGHLVSCDSWMNINLKKVIHTSKDGDKFWRVPECYIRGNTIKYLCIPDEIVDAVPDEPLPTPRSRENFKPRGSDKTRGSDRGRGNRGGGGGGDRGGGRGRGSGRGDQRGRGTRGGRGGRGRG